MIFKGIFYPAHLASLNLGRVYRTEPGKHPFFFGNWLTAIYENSTNLSSLFCAFAHKKDNCCWGKAPLVISPNSWVLIKDSAKNFKLILLSCEFWKIEKIYSHDNAKSQCYSKRVYRAIPERICPWHVYAVFRNTFLWYIF